MIIEWHTHVYPPEEAAADALAWDGKSGPTWAGKCPMTVENVLDAHHRAGVAVSVVSNAAHYMRGKSEQDELKAIQRWSDYAAEIQQEHKGTLYGFATILPCGGPAQIKEAERAIRQLGLKGILIQSNHKGHYPDDDEARPFWELVQDLDVPVFIHPPHVGFGEERVKEYRLASSVGRPADLCLAISRLIVRGILEDFPRVTLVSSHGGGGICEVIGRMNYAYELQEEAYFLGSYSPMKIKHEPGLLPEEDVLRHGDLSCAGGADGDRYRWRGSRALRQRRAAADLAEAARDQTDRRPRPSGSGQGKGVLAERCKAAQAI